MEAKALHRKGFLKLCSKFTGEHQWRSYLNCDFCRPVANKKYRQDHSRTSMVM